MKNSNQRLRFLNIYLMQLRSELDQMKAGPLAQLSPEESPRSPDFMTKAVVIAVMALTFASIFIVQ